MQPRLLLAALFPLVVCGQFDPAALLAEARAKIVTSAGKLTKYTCVQTVHRSRFEVLTYGKPARCSYAAKGQAPIVLAWTDQFKLDVTVAGGKEIFSWAGAREFQSGDTQEIVGDGLTGTGDFGPFLMDVFGPDAPAQRYLELERIAGRVFAVYGYQVPATSSRYQIKSGAWPNDVATLAYEGKFWIDKETGRLHRMTIVVAQPPAKSGTCRIETAIEYEPTLLPQLTVLKLWDNDGARHENRIEYNGCRTFQNESVFRPDADFSIGGSIQTENRPVTLPAGTKVQIALRSAIDGEKSFAGDEIEGFMAAQGAVVHGRIVRIERHFKPSRYFVVGLKFHSMTVNGIESPLSLEAVPGSKEEQMLSGPVEKRQGIGMFLFKTDRLVVDGGFVSEWRSVARKPSD